MGRGITVVHIYANELKRLLVPVPPLLEQSAICRFLEHACRRVQRHVSATKRQIDLLREFRTRLIADVVTGQFYIREDAVHCPRFQDSSKVAQT